MQTIMLREEKKQTSKTPHYAVQNIFKYYMNAFVTSTTPLNIKGEQGIC